MLHPIRPPGDEAAEVVAAQVLRRHPETTEATVDKAVDSTNAAEHALTKEADGLKMPLPVFRTMVILWVRTLLERRAQKA